MDGGFPVVIDAATLRQWRDDGRALRLVDARCAPVVAAAATGAGRAAWLAGHLPGAVHADLDSDLAGPADPVGGQGRHPLPPLEAFTATLGRWGIAPGSCVVVYDAADGSMAAARLWWLLRLLGHQQVAVLDGGIAAWVAAGGALESGQPQIAPAAAYPGQWDLEQVVDASQVMARLHAPAGWLLDARAPARYAGRHEPVDAVAGHVPGALNLPYASLVAEGRLLPPAQIRAAVAQCVGNRAMDDTVLMCGSGVTACHLLLALEHAGLHGARVFAGSWSGWISDSMRPVSVAGGH